MLKRNIPDIGNAVKRCLFAFLILLTAFHAVGCESEGQIAEKGLAGMCSLSVTLTHDKIGCRFGATDTVLADAIGAEFRLVTYLDFAECLPCLLDKMCHCDDLI